MISGNSTWLNALLQQSKQPLYTFEIPDFGIVVASFAVTAVNVTLGGYGVTLLGVGMFGT